MWKISSRSRTMNAKVVPERLKLLERRLESRFSDQPETPDLLPDPDSDLTSLTTTEVTTLPPKVGARRSDMSEQVKMLSKTFAGKSELELLHAVVISYLRRNTPHTAKAYLLFRRIWEEQSEFMLARLSIRWLISALQTFYDHSEVAGERVAGGIGFTYGNLIKVYETEHHARRRNRIPEADSYKNKSVPGMFGFKPGDDILINLNVIVLDAAKNGGLASDPLLKLLETVAHGKTIFQRTDSLADVAPFSLHPNFTFSFDGRK